MSAATIAARLSAAIVWCLGVAASAAAPRKDMSVSEWADMHRILTAKQSGERGRWHTSRTPFLREIMDFFSAACSATEMVIMKSSQVGVTEAIVNAIGYLMEHLPSSWMVMLPTLDNRDTWKAQKLNPLLTDTPVIATLLGKLKSRDAVNRADMIDFPGGIGFLAGGNSPSSYAQKSARVMIQDDFDRFPAEVGNEGDPGALGKGRTKAFMRGKHCKISTPTDTETSLIAAAYSKSDQRRYYVPCPSCGEHQPLEWGGKDHRHGIKWNEEKTAAWYVCRACFFEIQEHHKPAMLAAGRWIPENPKSKIRGYHITALMAPIGLGPSWLDLVLSWHEAVKSTTTLKTFINTDLGEPFDGGGEQTDPVGLLARLEDYPEGFRGLARIFATDVQGNRLETSVIDFGLGEEAWLQDHLIFEGDTARPEVWAMLHEAEKEWRPDAHGVDAGYNSSFVRAFVEKAGYRIAMIGRPGSARPLVEDLKKRQQRLRKQKRKGVQVEIIGDDQGKTLIYARLKLVEPGPGYIHFKNDPAFDDEYFAQLTAEKLMTKLRNGRPVHEYKQMRPRNETLDCLKMGIATLRLSGLAEQLPARAAKAKRDAELRALQAQGKAPAPKAKPPRKTGFTKGWK